MGKLMKAMYGALDGRHGPPDQRRAPSVYCRGQRGIAVVAHTCDLLYVGITVSLTWLFIAPKTQYGFKRHMLVPGSAKDIKYLSLSLRRGSQGIGRECDPKHAR